MANNVKSIVVTVMAATNTKGSRYKAVCDFATVIVERNYELEDEANAVNAARQLVQQINCNPDVVASGDYWELYNMQATLPGKNDRVFMMFNS